MIVNNKGFNLKGKKYFIVYYALKRKRGKGRKKIMDWIHLLKRYRVQVEGTI
jgi:hypothetical protein